jgi:hypothetical protein
MNTSLPTFDFVPTATYTSAEVILVKGERYVKISVPFSSVKLDSNDPRYGKLSTFSIPTDSGREYYATQIAYVPATKDI